MNEKISKIKLELLKEEFIKQIKDSYTLNLSMVLLEEFENLQQENTQLKDKSKDLEEWLEAMASMYENEYKDVNASEHYKCMLHKLKEN